MPPECVHAASSAHAFPRKRQTKASPQKILRAVFFFTTYRKTESDKTCGKKDTGKEKLPPA